MKRYKTALTIAGSDSGGGAGIQADLKTFAALGCYGVSAISALTAQNTQGVQSVLPISVRFIEKQLDSIFSDIKVKAIKTGMLFSADIIRVVAGYLADQKDIPLVIDPVMIAQSRGVLLKKDAISSLKSKLLPQAELLTPNLKEAECLLQRTINSICDMEQAAKDLVELGSKAVLVKGGHLGGKWSNDCLYIKNDKFYWFKAKRIITKNNHGTGCTLSAAITSFLAQGYSLPKAVAQAKKYITKALVAGGKHQFGFGSGPVDHRVGC